MSTRSATVVIEEKVTGSLVMMSRTWTSVSEDRITTSFFSDRAADRRNHPKKTNGLELQDPECHQDVTEHLAGLCPWRQRELGRGGGARGRLAKPDHHRVAPAGIRLNRAFWKQWTFGPGRAARVARR